MPNTEEGVSPAWSPDGEWIAFTRLERTDSTASSCLYALENVELCIQERTDYQFRRLLMLVHPDGTDVTLLGDGEEPAWSPDGGTLYFRRDNQIWRSAPDGSGAAPIDYTTGGHEPAVAVTSSCMSFQDAPPSVE